MEFYDAVKKRHSLRKYDSGRKVPEEVLKRILEAGRTAPSAANKQPWRFLVVSSEEMLKKVRSCYNASWFQDVPHVQIGRASCRERV